MDLMACSVLNTGVGLRHRSSGLFRSQMWSLQGEQGLVLKGLVPIVSCLSSAFTDLL